METIKQKTLGEYESKLSYDSPAYARIATLFDAGTFVELGKFVKRQSNEFEDASCDFEGVVTGYGAVDGKLVFVYSQDFSRSKGAFTLAQAKKIANIYDLALKSGAPVIGIIDTAGAKILEGVDALSGYGIIMNASARVSGIIPQIAIISGICSGAMATVASMADIKIGVKGTGKFFVAPPFNLGEKSGSIEDAMKSGAVTIGAENDLEAIAYAKKLIIALPSNNVEGVAYNEVNDSATRLTGGTNASEIALSLADAGSAVEFSSEFGKSVKTYISSVNGITVGVVAVNGKLSAADARKASGLVAFCDSFSVPVVTLVNCDGYELTKENETAPFANELARLAMAYASSTNAKVTVYVGNAIGSAFTVLGSKALGADIALATENANIAIMNTEAALEFVYGKEIYSGEDPMATKEEFKKEWEEKIASPVAAARSGDIDDVIAATDIRARVASALEMLSTKATKSPYKKHGNLPL